MKYKINKQELYSDYEKILMGEKRNYSSNLFNENANRSHENALEIMRYAFKIMRWKPKDIGVALNKDILKMMRLDILMKHIQFSTEAEGKDDYMYLAHLLYPKEIPYNLADVTLSVYKKVLSREIAIFPKKYLQGDRAEDRIKICFRYVLREHMIFHSVQEIYDFFSSPKGMKTLSEYLLLAPCNALYDSPIDLLHDTLSDLQKNEFYYQYYKFKSVYRKTIRESKKNAIEEKA